MDGPAVSLEPAAGALAYVEGLLERNDLPSADVRAKPDSFWVAYDGDDRVGVGGLEVHGSEGLLRSVAVVRAVRGRGYGTALCDALEARAVERGVDALYLLTTTASGFFGDRGFDEIERADAPASIRETTEFADLCPDSATCMRKSL